jgi:hypothetical protein
MQAMLAPERLSPVFIQEVLFSFFFPFLMGHISSVYLSACQDDDRTTHFSKATTTSTLTSATLALRGYHLHVTLIGFYSNHNIRAITTLQLRENVSSLDSTFDLFSSLTICGALTVTVGDVRVYLLGYIFYIIDCHICRDIFDRIDIMYCRLPYVSRGALPLKTLVFYIYRPRGTMQNNQQLYTIYSSYTKHSEVNY